MFDVLILGGGSAGCILASRLSEDADRRVALVEAGADLLPGSIPGDIQSGYPGRAFLNPAHLWPGLTAYMGGNRNDPTRAPRRYEQARVLGGGSSINAMAANRGAPADYDEWGELGAAGWSWDTVLPYFRKLEHDCDFDDPYHGKDGPIHISRYFVDRQSPFVRSACEVLKQSGYVPRQDQNGPWLDGIYPVAVARDAQGRRISAATAYLTPAVRARSNLTVMTRAEARRLLFVGSRATGAEVDIAGSLVDLHASEVIVCCGALHSPTLLLRSGIGPRADLKRLGLDVVADRAGVGANLMEHPSLALSAYLEPGARLSPVDAHQIHACLRFSSNMEDAPAGDLHMAIVAKAAWHAVGQRLGTLLVWVNKSYSRGHVRLAGPNSATPPIVDFRLLSDERDRERLKFGIKLAAEVITSRPVRQMAGAAFPAMFSDRVRMVTTPTLFNAIQTSIFGHALDRSFGLRDHLIRKFITKGVTLEALLDDEKVMDAFLSKAVGGTWHASGTCKMGSPDDVMAVTDAEGRVYGTQGLRVCDASLMPSIPCANTNMPTMMIAERISDQIRAAQRVANLEVSPLTS